MTARSDHAERQRRYRERQKIAKAGDFGLVRVFLEGVIADANDAIASGDEVPAWLLARSATATEVLAGLQQDDPDTRNPTLLNLICVARLGRLNFAKAEAEAALVEHEREFAAWLRRESPTKAKVVKTGAESIAMSTTILTWANDERVAGRSTAASLTQGLNAAKRLLRMQSRVGTAEEFARFSSRVQYHAIHGIVLGVEPLPLAESRWARPL